MEVARVLRVVSQHDRLQPEKPGGRIVPVEINANPGFRRTATCRTARPDSHVLHRDAVPAEMGRIVEIQLEVGLQLGPISWIDRQPDVVDDAVVERIDLCGDRSLCCGRVSSRNQTQQHEQCDGRRCRRAHRITERIAAGKHMKRTARASGVPPRLETGCRRRFLE